MEAKVDLVDGAFWRMESFQFTRGSLVFGGADGEFEFGRLRGEIDR